MKINSTKLLYFSPTKTTKKVVEAIAQGIQVDTVEQLDLTPPAARTRRFDEIRDELVIIGSPVYGGRIPIDASHRLQRLKANNTPAVIVVVYGNREYEDALLELKDLAVEAGFRPVAGGAFIGEHSFANDSTPIANGRPDTEDLKKAREFGKLILERLSDIEAFDDISPLQVPGNFPYKERKTRAGISPITQEERCTTCGTCATVCPTAAIKLSNSSQSYGGAADKAGSRVVKYKLS
jgi:flavodoxin/Pyruvate/2-oxoacid:ferredoxin oxidoreductase delta subunit